MNKTVLALAIFAFCLFPNVLSSNMRGSADRELGSINLGNLGNLGNIIGSLLGSKTSTTNTTAPAKNTPSAANTTAPINNSNSTGGSTAPAKNSTSSSTPATNTSSSVPSNTSSSSSPASSNTTQPSTTNNTYSATNTTSSTTNTTSTPAAPTWYAKNDVNMATFANKALTMHNILRSFVNVAPLTWSDSLAASAQAWAENMAANGFRHSGRTGENIASTTASTKVVDYLFDLWTREQNWFIKGCRYPDCSSNFEEVGHYTQMVWSTTTQVGCGFAPGADKQWNYLCCQYYKAGNIIGSYVYPYTVPAN